MALLLAVSFTFVAATLPRCAALIATEFVSRSLYADDPALDQARVYGSVRLALAATDLLMYANHAVNFFLYCATGQRFRRQLCAVVGVVVGRRPRRAPSSRFAAATQSVPLRRMGGSRSVAPRGGKSADHARAAARQCPSNVSL